MCARENPATASGEGRAAGCCPLYHEAVELVGRRWTGAILRVLMDGPLRFSQIGQAVPELSDRLAQSGMSAEIWNPHGLAPTESSGNSDAAADDFSQQPQQQSSAGNGRDPEEQNPQSSNGFQLDGGDGEND